MHSLFMLSKGENVTIAIRDESRGDIFLKKSPIQMKWSHRKREIFAMRDVKNDRGM